MKLRKNKKGFTIVELVIVIGVIGILSAILIPTFVNLNSKAQDAALKSDLSAVYSSYVADVADGYYGEPTTDGTNKAEKMYGQNEVALSKDGVTFYVYNASNDGWDIVGKSAVSSAENSSQIVLANSSSALGYMTTSGESEVLAVATYSGYSIYVRA